MSGNTIGQIFKVTTYGESHGKAIGAVIDGCPAGLAIDTQVINEDLAKRRPGYSELTSTRKEPDECEILSGILDGVTLGTPISILIRNKDSRSEDYDHLKDIFRPSHADFTYQKKYGIRDHRGGGRSSARETAARVAAGSIAKQLLQNQKISIDAYVEQIGQIRTNLSYLEMDLSSRWASDTRCPDPTVSTEMAELVRNTGAEEILLEALFHVLSKICLQELENPYSTNSMLTWEKQC